MKPVTRVVESLSESFARETLSSSALFTLARLCSELDLIQVDFSQPQIALRSETFSDVGLTMIFPVTFIWKLEVWIMFRSVVSGRPSSVWTTLLTPPALLSVLDLRADRHSIDVLFQLVFLGTSVFP